MRLLLSRFFRLRLSPLIAILLFAFAAEARAQSTDARFPTPVSANEIADSIAARDIGDSRLTDYFYTFTGLPGDLLVTVESRNLNGDIDIFTAGELRPLLKITFYAESTTASTKNIYLRKRQSLILRIEARTPNDDPGTFRIRFSGSFEPAMNSALEAQSEKPADANKDSGKSGDRKTTRVNSAGARIDEPVDEIATAPVAKPTPKPKPTPSPTVEKTATKEPPKTVSRTARTRRPPPRKPAPKTPDTAAKADKDTADTQVAEPVTNKPGEPESAAGTTDKNAAEEEAKKPESAESKPPPNRRPPARRPAPRRPARTPAAQPESKARLVIEQKDGTRREFLMSNVRKVTVENGEILVENNEGVTQRISMAQVARMSIGP